MSSNDNTTVDDLSKSLKKKVTFDESSIDEKHNDDDLKDINDTTSKQGSNSNNFGYTKNDESESDNYGWPIQDVSSIDVNNISPLDPVIMHRQATLNIGTIGHVAHGKSTVVKAITGVQTVRFKTELERNITIKLGYANAKIFKCDNSQCARPGNYQSFGSKAPAKPTCKQCGSQMTLQRHVSFVDCPGM